MGRFRHRLPLMLLATTPLLASPATLADLSAATATITAQASALTAGAPRLIDETVITARRTEQVVTSHVGNIASLDSETLELTAHSHIQESLNRLAGVNFHRNNGQEYLPAIRSPVLSGPGACGSVLIMENGVPLRPAGFCNVNELFEANTEQARRIEVIRGPGTAVYGANALHGIVNIIDPAEPGAPTTIGLEGGPHDYVRGRVHWSSDSLAIAANVTHDGGYRDDSGVDQQKLSVQHRHQVSGALVTTSFTAVNLEQETAGFATGRNAYRDRSLSRRNPNPEAYRDVRAARVSSRIDWQNGWTLTPYARYSEMEFLQHFLPGQPLEENGQHSVGLLTQKTFSVNEAVDVITGVDVEYADTWLKEYQANAAPNPVMPQGYHYDYDVQSAVVAPFLQAEWQLSERWKVNLGGRYEWTRYDYDNRMIAGRTRDDGTPCPGAGCRYSRPGDRKDRFDNLSGKLGIAYQLNDQQWYLSLSQGYRPPQMTEMYRLQGDQNVADLDPEKIVSLELGWRGQYGRLGYDFALFSMRKDNVIYRDTNQFNIDDGKMSHEGFEYQLEYRFNDQWQAGISGTWARHRYENNAEAIDVPIKGNDVDTAPRHFGSAQLSWRPLDSLFAELEWVMMGSYYLDPENDHRYGGHDLLHLRARWQATDHLTLSFRLLNLTDRKYAERADYATFASGAGQYRYFPGEPRSLYVGVEYRFR